MIGPIVVTPLCPPLFNAMQYTRNGLQAEQVASWCGGEQNDEGIIIPDATGAAGKQVLYGDWILKGASGHPFAVTNAEFVDQYGEV